MALIRLENVDLIFHIRKHRRTSFKEYVLKRLFLRSVNPVMEIPALHDVSLEILEGDRVGVLGHNGAGKSTLLKILAGVYPPTGGKRVVEGHISSLFDLMLGFEPEASGWENISYRGYLQGETPRSIKEKMLTIAEFSELGDFLSMPVKYYSSGMLVRLAFSISTAVDPEVLLIDEVLSAGDMAFQKKAKARMLKMIDSARLFVMVSHDMDALQEFCNRGVWLDHGCIRMKGSMDEVIAAYKREINGTPKSESEAVKDREAA